MHVSKHNKHVTMEHMTVKQLRDTLSMFDDDVRVRICVTNMDGTSGYEIAHVGGGEHGQHIVIDAGTCLFND